MEKMERAETQNRARPQIRPYGSKTLVTYKGYGGDFEIEIKQTGYARAPFVGILRASLKICIPMESRTLIC